MYDVVRHFPLKQSSLVSSRLLHTELNAETIIIDEQTGQRRLKASSAQVSTARGFVRVSSSNSQALTANALATL